MSIFRLKGTITAIGAGTMTEGGTKHDWIEITPDGGRVYGVTRVWVGANAARGVCPGVRGEFFLDRVFVLGAPTRIWKQLYGIRIDGGQAVYDRTSLRAAAIALHIKLGVIFLVVGIGALWLTFAALQLTKAAITIGARRRAFLGGQGSAGKVREREAVRI
ncbi:MAG: hypothetical protein AB1490_11705 [Pseudomonadota bacterium]